MSPSEEAEKQNSVVASSASERVASECALHCARCRCCRKSKMTISPFCPPPGGSPWLTRKWKRRLRAGTKVSAAASPGIQVAKAPLSGPEGGGSPEQEDVPLERWVAAWAAASWPL